jgi:hypothetical protein
MGFLRTEKVFENLSGQFRFEAFNIMNHATAATTGLHTAMNDPLFGTINAANKSKDP